MGRCLQADKELQIATWAGDVSRLESAVEEARAAGVAASALSLAEQVLDKEKTKRLLESDLESAAYSRDVRRLEAALNHARKGCVGPMKIREAERILRGVLHSVQRPIWAVDTF